MTYCEALSHLRLLPQENSMSRVNNQHYHGERTASLHYIVHSD